MELPSTAAGGVGHRGRGGTAGAAAAAVIDGVLVFEISGSQALRADAVWVAQEVYQIMSFLAY